MGVVMRQGIKYSIVTYVFMVISIFAAMFLYPHNKDLYGTLNFFVDMTMLLTPVLLLGSSMVSVKFFPEMKMRNESSNTLLSTGFIAIVISTIGVVALGYLFYPLLQQIYSQKSLIINVGDYIWIFIPLLLIVCVYSFLILHISNFKLIVVPKLVQSSWRVSLPVIFLLVWLEFVSVEIGLGLVIAHFLLATLALLFYLNKLEKIKISFGKKTLDFIKRKDVLTYGGFALLTSLGSSLAFKLDSVMVTTMLDTTNNGIFAIANRISSMIIVPSLAIIGIASPIISEAMKKKHMDEVQDIYRRSSEVLTIAGVIMLSGLAVIIFDLYGLIVGGDEMIAAGAIYVVGFVALARFIDMTTSVNSQIISMSEQFRFNLYFLLTLAVMNTVLNIVLIPMMGIKGAALATLISLASFNLLKLTFIKVRFDMWPFSMKTVLIIGIGVVSVFLVSQMATLIQVPKVLGMGIKGALVVSLIFSALYFPKVSLDFNHAVNVGIRRAQGIFK